MSIAGAIVVTVIALIFGVSGLLMSWRFVNKLQRGEPVNAPAQEPPSP